MPINQPLYGEFKMSVNQQTLVTGYEYNGETRTFGAGSTTTLENLINVLARQNSTFSDPSKYTVTVVDGIAKFENRTGSKA